LVSCGDVSFAKAVQIIVTQAEEHDQLVASLRTEDGRARFLVEQNQAHEALFEAWAKQLDPTAKRLVQTPSDEDLIRIEGNPDFWRSVAPLLLSLDRERAGEIPGSDLAGAFYRDITKASRGGYGVQQVIAPDFKMFRDLAEKVRDEGAQVDFQLTAPKPPRMHDREYLDRLNTLRRSAFGPDSPRPKDADDLDEYEIARRKLERRISAISPATDTVSAVLAHFMEHNSIREATRRKYRRDTARLIRLIGDVPVGHIRSEDLRRLRDHEAPKMRPASLHAIFTPIKSMLSYALGNQIIQHDPVRGLTLPTDRRTVEERKWRKFDPDQMARILGAVDVNWGQAIRGLSNERRIAIRMAVRVLAYTAMRPIEVLRLRPEDVEPWLIRVMGSKNEGSDRVIPVHPAIRDFHCFIHGGGMETFRSSKTDPVTPVRHNFDKLIHDKLDPPIADPKQVLYSLRSTFQNAMRRAGAPVDVRRAILGHKEAGALRHYDDGPWTCPGFVPVF
jgi:integrase